jgi:hypothetical protein
MLARGGPLVTAPARTGQRRASGSAHGLGVQLFHRLLDPAC